MRIALEVLIENDALNVELALSNCLDADVYVDQFQPTRDWPPVRLGYVTFMEKTDSWCCTSAPCPARPAFFSCKR